MDLVTRSAIFALQLRVSNSKVKKKNLTNELLTQTKIFQIPTSN